MSESRDRQGSTVTLEIGDTRGNHQGRSSSPSAHVDKKGKGGRKVMFPSAEEKKQRNRDSQAAFRERRKEHINELEKVVQDQKDKMQELQMAQASAKEEILIWKYKNSLLERILLEQGIDVNAELNNVLAFPPRVPEKRTREERLLPRQEREARAVTTPAKRPNLTSMSPRTTEKCCHCSGLQVSSLPAVIHPAPTSEETRANKRRRHDTSHIARSHPHSRLIQPVQRNQVFRPQRPLHPGKYSHHPQSFH
ncbi:hypothetical protein PZA11_005123 [Diplocarpon coronariae]